jgi:hypothetical protein
MRQYSEPIGWKVTGLVPKLLRTAYAGAVFIKKRLNMASQRWQCTYCGQLTSTSGGQQRPLPGNCMRKPKTKDGKYKPHTWVKTK